MDNDNIVLVEIISKKGYLKLKKMGTKDFNSSMKIKDKGILIIGFEKSIIDRIKKKYKELKVFYEDNKDEYTSGYELGCLSSIESLPKKIIYDILKCEKIIK